jgi:hypothetical protein
VYEKYTLDTQNDRIIADIRISKKLTRIIKMVCLVNLGETSYETPAGQYRQRYKFPFFIANDLSRNHYFLFDVEFLEKGRIVFPVCAVFEGLPIVIERLVSQATSINKAKVSKILFKRVGQ